MSSLSSHLVDDYSRNRSNNHNNIVTSGAMEYNSAAHGHQSVSFSQFPAFSQSPSMQGRSLGLMAPILPSDISLRTAQHIATLQAKLDKKLGPEFISQRPGPGGVQKLTYVEGWKVINLANEVFGFNGWSSSISNLTVDYIDYNQETQRYNVGVTAIVKVVLRDGVSHEDVGYGILENCKSKGMALDKCKKEAVTDAIKRTLRNFGNVLGNCLYDKEYTKDVMKMKLPPPKFDESQLHRRKEFVVNTTPAASVSAAGIKTPHQRPMAPPPPRLPSIPITSLSRPSTSTLVSSSNTLPLKSHASATTSIDFPPKDPKPISKEDSDDYLYAFASDDLFDSVLDESLGDAAAVNHTSSDNIQKTALPSTSDLLSSVQEPVISKREASKRTSALDPSSTRSSILAGLEGLSWESSQDNEEAMNKKDSLEKEIPIIEAGRTLNESGRTLNQAPLPTQRMPSVSPSTNQAPRVGSAGGFHIPPGVVRPNRPSHSTPRTTRPAPASTTSTIGSKPSTSNIANHGVKRSADDMRSEDGGRIVLGELPVSGVGQIKRPRLS